jgi:hypothetical protein
MDAGEGRAVPFDDATKLWSLYWSDRNGRWHPYEDVEPSANVGDLPRRLMPIPPESSSADVPVTLRG